MQAIKLVVDEIATTAIRVTTVGNKTVLSDGVRKAKSDQINIDIQRVLVNGEGEIKKNTLIYRV